MVLSIQTHPDHHRVLIRAAASFAGSVTDTAKIGVIQFDETAELIPGIAVLHGLLNLVVHEPGGIVAEVKLAA